MAFDRDEDWVPRRKSEEAMRRSIPDLRARHHAALSISEVTGDEHWDRFLEIVQGRIVDVTKMRDEALERLKTSDDFTETLINQKLAVRLYGRDIEALQWVVRLPKDILEDGDRAKELLGSIDESTH